MCVCEREREKERVCMTNTRKKPTPTHKHTWVANVSEHEESRNTSSHWHISIIRYEKGTISRYFVHKMKRTRAFGVLTVSLYVHKRSSFVYFSGTERRIDVSLPKAIQLPVGASDAFVSMQLPVRVIRLDGDKEDTLVDLPLKISVQDAPDDHDERMKAMVAAILG